MPLETILLFLITDLMFCFTPGPATMVVVSHALPPGREGGLRGAAGPIVGVNIGNFIWYGLTALGLIALIQSFPAIYAVLRWAGVLYLLWMGITMLRARNARLAGQTARAASFKRGFLSGLAVHMSNPKALAFYTLFIPPFIDPDGSLWVQFAILAGVTLFTETAGLTFYAALAARLRNLGDADKAQKRFRTTAGCVLILVAALLVWMNMTAS